MVEYYFDDICKQKELLRIMESWLHPPTQYKHKIGVKSMGCDCIHFVARVLEEVGLLDFKYIHIPDYPRDWHLHNTREVLAEAIEKYLNVRKRSVTGTLINGDIILSHYGKASSHAGIYFDNYVYQSLDNVGVRKITFNDAIFKKRMKSVYRIKL